jgi:beta-lactamase regulating signal transducer with metallopeptidase domain
MIDYLFQMGLSNACFSLALAIVAMVVGAKARRPGLAYLLWLLVFIKLLTPPIVTIPVVTIPTPSETAMVINENSQPGLMLSNNPQFNIEVSQWSKFGSSTWNRARVWLPPIWLLGSAVVFGFSIVRVCRFSRMLATKSEAAPQELQSAAVEIAHRLGLSRIPMILTTSASLSPMVWWAGGKVRIVIPKALLDRMDAQQWQWILAHELAHVRRRDYLVRWLEWLACVCFWWNPVVWWAQRNLRAAEEICCDELVLSSLNPKPKFYANSLLSAVEFLAGPVFRPPAMASEINSGGFLERRFKMIVSDNPKKSNTRWLQVCVLLCAVVVLPLGIASAADYEAVGRRLRAAVAAGELTSEEARAMLGALRKAGEAKDKKDIDYEAVGRRIRAAVAAGEMTEEQGRERLAAFRRRMEMAERGERGERRITREDYARTEAELDKAIAAGRISEEDAKARLNEMRKMMAGQSERGQRSITIEEYKRAEAKMRKMIEDGKAKPEDVERRLIEMRKMIGDRSERGQRSITVEEYRRAEEKMRKMIEDGKAKPEDVERRLIEMRKMIGDQSKRGGERQRTTNGDKRAEYEGFERRIKAAVEAGKMNREEAAEKLEAYKKRASADDGKKL